MTLVQYQVSPVRVGACVFCLCLAAVMLTLAFAREISVDALGDGPRPAVHFTERVR